MAAILLLVVLVVLAELVAVDLVVQVATSPSILPASSQMYLHPITQIRATTGHR